MSRPRGAHSFFSCFGNPFGMVVPKRSSHVSAKHNELLKAFEDGLIERLKQLRPSGEADFINLEWMQRAVEVLSATHSDVKSLITDLSFPVTEWQEDWMNEYLDDTAILMDICIALNAEISKFEQGQLLVQYILHVLDFSGGIPSSDSIFRARYSLQDLTEETGAETRKKVTLKNGRMERCTVILQDLSRSLQLGKLKSVANVTIFSRAMYGMKATTILICGALVSGILGSPAPLADLQIPDQLLWSISFMNLQREVNEEIRNRFAGGRVAALKELGSLDVAIKNVYCVIGNSPVDIPKGLEDVEQIKEVIEELQRSAELFVQGLDPLTEQVKYFFQIVLNGRNTLLDSLRMSRNEDIPAGDEPSDE